MPAKISHTPDGGIIVQAEGVVKAEDMIEINGLMYETKEKIEKIIYQIIDFTGIQDFSYTDADIDMIAFQDKRAYDINPNMLIAVVSDQDLLFGLARMWEAKALSPLFRTKVFRKLEDAQIWINEKLKST